MHKVFVARGVPDPNPNHDPRYSTGGRAGGVWGDPDHQLKFVFVFGLFCCDDGGLGEAYRSDVEAEFLVGGCLDGDVLDWEHLEVFGVDLEHTSSPCVVLVLALV